MLEVTELDHWLTDVLGAYFEGALYLVAFIILYQWTISKLEERRANRLAEKSTQAQTAWDTEVVCSVDVRERDNDDTGALATAAAGSIAQYTLWRANSLPHRLLGAFGLLLLLLALVLQGGQPAIDILNSSVPKHWTYTRHYIIG
jgi:hypothetical protein